MKGIIDNITDRLIVLMERLNRSVQKINDFLKKGERGSIILAIFIVYMGLKISVGIYTIFGNPWMASIPLALFAFILFFTVIKRSYKDKMKARNRVSRIRLVGLNLDFNQRILGKIYRQLTKYGYLDEELTSFQDFYNVLVLDFDEHGSALHFNCTQPQLKYILEKFKQYKKGIRLKTFERSQKVYHKGNLISSEILSKKYHESPPDQKFEQQIDSFFDFLGDI